MQQPKLWDTMRSSGSLSSPYIFQIKELSQVSKRLAFLKQDCPGSPDVPIMDILLYDWIIYLNGFCFSGIQQRWQCSQISPLLSLPTLPSLLVVRMGHCAWFSQWLWTDVQCAPLHLRYLQVGEFSISSLPAPATLQRNGVPEPLQGGTVPRSIRPSALGFVWARHKPLQCLVSGTNEP